MTILTVNTTKKGVMMKAKGFSCALCLVLMVALLVQPALPVRASVRQVDPTGFLVNSVADGADSNIGDGICSTGVSCTFRAALQEAAAFSSSTQLISFDLPPRTLVQVLTPLPALSDGDQIWGNGRIILDGSKTPDNAADIGLYVNNSEFAVVRGLTIQNFSQAGIYIRGSNKLIGGSEVNARNVIINNGIGIDFAFDNVYDNIIRGNYIGIAADGVTAQPNNIGIQVDAKSSSQIGDITIGGDIPGERNIISGNTQYGIKVNALNQLHLFITGNYIGTNAAGTAAVPNGRQGILITNSSAIMEIGGAAAGQGNLIAGNTYDGVLLQNSWNAKFLGNKMSTNADATAYLPNQYNDISIEGGLNAYIYYDIGGDTAEKGNILLNGAKLQGTTSAYLEEVLIQNNWIGITPSGATRIPTTGDGLLLNYITKSKTIGNRISHFDKGIRLLNGTNNYFSLNRINANATLGIDLKGDGVTANDAGDGDSGPNQLQNFPLITNIQFRDVSLLKYMDIYGTLNTTPNTKVRIELFSSPSCHPSGYGEGYDALRNLTVTTDGSGNYSWSVTNILYEPRSEYIGGCITATATAITVSDTVYNTSEFSPGVYTGRKLFLPTVSK